jgi:hypothetical protein
MRALAIATLLIALAGLPACAEPENQWWVNANPIGTLPLGSSADLFTMGAGFKSSFSYVPGFTRYFGLKTGGSYFTVPLESPLAEQGVWTASGFAGPVVRVPLGERFSVYADAEAGYYQWGGSGWDAGASAGGGFVAGAGAGALFKVAGYFTLGASVSYDFYSSLYIGVETAFITVPGHIYAAFALKASEEETRKTFSTAVDLIFRNGVAWIPVEITIFQESFEKAWQTGAK